MADQLREDAENRTLRDALEEIISCPLGKSKTWPEIEEIARAALSTPSDQPGQTHTGGESMHEECDAKIAELRRQLALADVAARQRDAAVDELANVRAQLADEKERHRNTDEQLRWHAAQLALAEAQLGAKEAIALKAALFIEALGYVEDLTPEAAQAFLQKQLAEAQQARERYEKLSAHWHSESRKLEESLTIRERVAERYNAERDAANALLRRAQEALESEDGQLNDEVYAAITAHLAHIK